MIWNVLLSVAASQQVIQVYEIPGIHLIRRGGKNWSTRQELDIFGHDLAMELFLVGDSECLSSSSEYSEFKLVERTQKR